MCEECQMAQFGWSIWYMKVSYGKWGWKGGLGPEGLLFQSKKFYFYFVDNGESVKDGALGNEQSYGTEWLIWEISADWIRMCRGLR